ncbi:hypothetical protein ACFQ0G_08270 [Streptomyces chiangmaiensis]
MHAVGGEPVVGDEPAHGPVAGGDDGGYGTQGRAFLGVQFGRGPRVEARLVAEGQVHQDGQAQAFGLRHHDLGDAAGDQAVEQDDRAVWQFPQCTGQLRAGGGVGPGPRALDGVLVDLPAEARQVEADPAVVGVAAARSGRVVHAARHDEVHTAQ